MKIELNNCSKIYNNKAVINGLNHCIESGDRLAILGKNGSGKSTLCKLIAGIIGSTSGNIKWEYQNKEIDIEKVYAKLAYSAPAMELPGEFTLPELISFNNKFKPAEHSINLDWLVDVCGFDGLVTSRKLKNYSSGMLQRVKLCLAMGSKMPLIILDEPTENFDINGIKLYNDLYSLLPSSSTVVIATNRESDLLGEFSTIEV